MFMKSEAVRKTASRDLNVALKDSVGIQEGRGRHKPVAEITKIHILREWVVGINNGSLEGG